MTSKHASDYMTFIIVPLSKQVRRLQVFVCSHFHCPATFVCLSVWSHFCLFISHHRLRWYRTLYSALSDRLLCRFLFLKRFSDITPMAVYALNNVTTIDACTSAGVDARSSTILNIREGRERETETPRTKLVPYTRSTVSGDSWQLLKTVRQTAFMYSEVLGEDVLLPQLDSTRVWCGRGTFGLQEEWSYDSGRGWQRLVQPAEAAGKALFFTV